MNTQHTYLIELIDHLLKATDRRQMEKTLNGILTPNELQEIPRRLQIINMLKEGIPQREIAKKLGVGIATVTRGSRALQNENLDSGI